MSKKYYILVGKPKEGKNTTSYELIFGDYERSVVVQEKEDISKDEYSSLKVVSVDSDSQAAIDKKVKSLNESYNDYDTREISKSLILHAARSNMTKFEEAFNSALSSKLIRAIEEKKPEIAEKLFSENFDMEAPKIGPAGFKKGDRVIILRTKETGVVVGENNSIEQRNPGSTNGIQHIDVKLDNSGMIKPFAVSEIRLATDNIQEVLDLGKEKCPSCKRYKYSWIEDKCFNCGYTADEEYRDEASKTGANDYSFIHGDMSEY